MKENRLDEIGVWLNTQGYELDLADPFWMEDWRFGEHKVRDIAELLDAFCDAEVDRRIKERMPSEKTIDLWWKDFQWGLAAPDEYLEGLEAGFRGGIKYTFSRLSQKTDNLKENNNNGSTN